MAAASIFERPRPPVALTEIGLPDRFEPAPELLEWIRASYIDPKGPLYFEAHQLLATAEIGVLWTNVDNCARGRRIAGQAELCDRLRHMNKWLRGRIYQQVGEWFGRIPDFILTFDSLHAVDIDDASFCALVDHELCHCAPETDEFGAPKFNRATGQPKWTIRGHDVEEFVSVVDRFGVEAAGEAVTDMVIAAASPPRLGRAEIGRACGTCLRLAA